MHTDTITVSIDSATVFDLGPDRVLCGSETIQFDVPGFDQYQWIPAADLSCTDCGNPAAQPKISRTYTLLARTAAGCYSVDSIRVVLSDTVQTIEIHSVCAGDSAFIFGQWRTAAGVYSQILQATSGCDSVHSISLTIAPLPAASIEWEGPGCSDVADGYISILFAPQGLSYSLDGVQFQSKPAFSGLKAGSYRLFIRDTHLCITVLDIHLPPPDSLWLQLPGDTTILPGQWVQLTANTNAVLPTYSWSPADFLDCVTCAAPVAAPLISSTYTLSVQDINGCTVSARTTVRVIEPPVYVPNVFQPEQPGSNSLFTVFAGPGVRQVLFIEIFDRWGGLVYRQERFTPNGPEGWDGHWRGQDCPPGVYAFVLEVEFTDGSRLKISGDVTLVR